MIQKKITSGFVVQLFDTETNTFIQQVFVAGDECDYENEYGEPVTGAIEDAYLPFEMVQPQQLGVENE